MGTERGIEVRGDSIRITFPYKNERCRETLKIPPTAKNIKYAQNKRAQILYEIEIGTFDYAAHFPNSAHAKTGRSRSDLTVLQAVELSLKTRILTATTLNRYRRIIDSHLAGEFGQRPIRSVLPSELDELKVELAKTRRPKTVNNILIILRGGFEVAHGDGVIKANPAARIKNVRNPRTSDADPFEPAELARLMDAFEPEQRDMIDFWWNTGLREAELYGLEWGDIDWAGSIHVRRGRVEGQTVDTKTKRDRFVVLSDRALRALKRQEARSKLKGDSVWLNPDTGLPWHHPVVFYRKWKRACTRAKVRFRPPKQLRHTYASMALSAGEPPLFVMNQLGHSSLTMLERHYAKWMPRANISAGRGFNDVAAKVGT